MSDIAVQVEGLGKKYQIGAAKKLNRSFREFVTDTALSPFRKAWRLAHGHAAGAANLDQTFWALEDVSFDLNRGEVLGVVGRNGAGKSTLLKILSRITEPTKGRALLHGRVGSLLEVGTGFHPELTGRENVFLNGSILGMTKARIREKFDDIVEFSEIHAFIDTPVKHYSSGMYTRLAFAVAAHLEPEILIVDEVLSVGDVQFQSKCLGKMQEVSREGRTVLFVSHNMAAVQSLCTSAVLLAHGKVLIQGATGEVVAHYLNQIQSNAQTDLAERKDRAGRGHIRMVQVEVTPPADGVMTVLQSGCPAEIRFRLSRACMSPGIRFTIYDPQGLPVATFSSNQDGPDDQRQIDTRTDTVVCRIPELLLMPGPYRLNAALDAEGEMQDHVEGAGCFDVQPGVLRGRPVQALSGYGRALIPHAWTV
jgi:lipopolysaccharide transport system ATP-binding protein